MKHNAVGIELIFSEMALRVPPTSTWQALPHTRTVSTTPRVATHYIPSSTLHLHRSFPLFASKPIAWSGRCRATSPGPPPPPDSEPSAGEDPVPGVGPGATSARFQDTAQIFFAVLFWMSLFFWSSACDGGNNGRPNKGSRFRR